jgi:hypothetical protein
MVCGLLKWEGELVGGAWFDGKWGGNYLWWHMKKKMGDGKNEI